MSELIAPLVKTGQAVCTLFEGDYHYGVAALVNSLAHAGFNGTVWVGYRGALPPWVDQLKPLSTPGEFLVANQIRLAFLPLDSVKIHFANYKPDFMLDLLANQAKDSEYLWYFDPDICLRCSWKFFERWSRHGIAICQEATNNILPANDPLCMEWIEIGLREGLGQPKPLHYYFNSGMVGIAHGRESYLRNWKHMIDLGVEMGASYQCIGTGTREFPLHILDQDAMNIAAIFSEHPLTTMGPDAMGFVHGGYTMYHVRGPKPWQGSLLKRLLLGKPPCSATKFYFTQVSEPIRPYSPLTLRMKKLSCDLGALLGRFYSRN